MTVIHMRPIGWGDMTPSQWGTVRDMIKQVLFVAEDSYNIELMWRAHQFLSLTEGRDV